MGRIAVIEFFMDMKPPATTAQQKGVNYEQRRHYTKDKVKAVKRKLRGALAGHRVDEPYEGPLRITVKIIWPWLKKHKAADRARGYKYKDTIPDLDNVEKALYDVMEDLKFFYKGDQQLASKIVEKFWGDRMGIYIRLETIEY